MECLPKIKLAVKNMVIIRSSFWIELGQDRDRWLAIVSAVMNLRAH
jgi:hypothetical protein